MPKGSTRLSRTTHSELELFLMTYLKLIFLLSRWLAPLLAHTLPLPSVLPIWDAIFSRPSRTRDSNPKADYLVDICASMLVRAKGVLFTYASLSSQTKRS